MPGKYQDLIDFLENSGVTTSYVSLKRSQGGRFDLSSQDFFAGTRNKYHLAESKVKDFWDKLRNEQESGMMKKWGYTEEEAKAKLKGFKAATRSDKFIRQLRKKQSGGLQDIVNMYDGLEEIEQKRYNGEVYIGDPPYTKTKLGAEKWKNLIQGTWMKVSDIPETPREEASKLIAETRMVQTEQQMKRIIRKTQKKLESGQLTPEQGSIVGQTIAAHMKMGFAHPREQEFKEFRETALFPRIAKKAGVLSVSEAQAIELIKKRKVPDVMFLQQARQYFTPEEIIQHQLVPRWQYLKKPLASTEVKR